ncbi:HAD-like domain-containing protein [Suillus clintonianus]|uniref:HAD-like domain-containing protein n=1 Tax=Suillus clintonianus TaxID=1904413 RepID=UPI001B872BE9|nr:HAD-like domain-containing protein [Suillus clintonianus]KAG2132100.1 HAD-like domain-containing protein [Suillus clintonianus]
MAVRARPIIRALLIDISGTLMIGSTPTGRVVEALAELRRIGFPFRFCSNTSKESTSVLQKRMLDAGFDVRESQELWTSLKAVRSLIQSRGLRRPYFLLSESAKDECRLDLHDTNVPYDAVIVGLAPALFDYDHLNSAFRVLIGEEDDDDDDSQKERNGSEDPKASIPLIALHKARYIESSGGHGLALGPGPFVAALENATGREAEVLGKPSKGFFSTVIESLDVEGPDSEGCIAVIGDDIQTDLGGGAIELCLWRILVKTGKYRSGDECKDGVHAPDEVCDSFADFVDSLLSCLK